MELIRISLAVSTLLCSLVAGFLLGFAIVVMPGIRYLGDRGFLQAFKVMDGIIQNNQPVFVFVWVGSVIAVLASALISVWQLQGLARILVISACVIYLAAVQLPTATINVPLNNQLQTQDLVKMTEPELVEARKQFEPRWLRWNSIRTVAAILTTVLLLMVMLKI